MTDEFAVSLPHQNEDHVYKSIYTFNSGVMFYKKNKMYLEIISKNKRMVAINIILDLI
jgi:hypothetical protein